MAAALSRALKLPGKKGSELGEYDPLTQADSEDESEEDDLVLNYPRNGLGRDGCLGSGPSKLRGGRSGRLYWSHREPGRDRSGEDRGGAGTLGGAGTGVHSTEAEEKRMRMKTAIRSAFFLVPLVCAALLVLLCAFLIPCRKGDLGKRPTWERALGDAGGVTPPALALWDVDGDSAADVFLGVTEWTNDTHPMQGNKIYRAVALSAVTGQTLWTKEMRECVMYIQCGLQYSSQPGPVVLLIGKSIIMAVNGTTGNQLWFVLLKNIESQAVLLPDLQGDSVPDLLIATLPADEALDLSLTLISGLSGGAYYILFGLGNVEAISLRDIYMKATGKMPLTQALSRRDPGWEALKKTNSSSFIHIYRGSEQVEFLLPLVAGFGNSHNSLDPVSNLNSSRSDWALVSGKLSSKLSGKLSSKLSVLRQKDIKKEWTFNSDPIHSQPAPGYFNSDGVLDLFITHATNGTMTALVVDGANGRLLWSAEFVCPRLVLETSAISTSTGQSAFLFWASDPIKALKNGTKTTVSPGVAEPLIRKLFLLHPAYPTILLELTSTTDTAVTSAVSYQERQKDASYITVSSRPTPDSEPGARIVKSMSLRAAITTGQTIRLEESSKPGQPVKPSAFEINKFFRGLTFKRQVRKTHV
ncbi:Protein FAM234B [Dissostichus eleginoides]|uniref:Protein FAM234B n=1 Tax=Dissostichus eleginoides TaxID=100907 RepID=A0AAD9B640_DISEL|nr:Protein FAM234B [Dissostichus eleginoides]